MNEHPFPFPTSFDLHGFFGTPNAGSPDEPHRPRYEYTDERGVRVSFSFDWVEASVQTELSIGDRVLETVSHKGVRSIALEAGVLTCSFVSPGSQTSCVVKLTPHVLVRWSNLVNLQAS